MRFLEKWLSQQKSGATLCLQAFSFPGPVGLFYRSGDSSHIYQLDIPVLQVRREPFEDVLNELKRGGNVTMIAFASENPWSESGHLSPLLPSPTVL